MKDLPDLALLAQIGPLESTAVRKALEATFAFRKTHPLPAALPSPPASWSSRYAKIARDDELTWQNIDELVAVVRGFLNPVLAGVAAHDGTWDPASWTWQTR